KLSNTTAVGRMAFSECAGLLEVDLPNVTALDSHAFTNCKTLELASLPKLRTMESRAFYSCVGLKFLTLGEEPPELLGRGYWFKNVYTDKIIVPTAESIEKYKETFEFADFKIRLIGDDSSDEDDGVDPFAHVYEPISTSHYLVDSRKGPYYTGDYQMGLNFY